MAISVISRPEKTLSSGYVSRWNASRTPLNYKFSSDLFPVNSVDTASNIQSFTYDSSLRGTKLEFLSTDNVSIGDFVKVESTNKIDGIHKVIDIITGFIVIDLFTTESEVSPLGTFQRYYKGYKGLAKVYAGAPSYHPYNTDASKPLTEIGTIEVEFDSSNEGIANVRNFIKPDMTSAFDYNDDNSHFAWTSFAIEYAEIWDGSDDPTFEKDILENCTPFVGFTNESFDSGLTDWTLSAGDVTWVAGTGEVIATGTGGGLQRFTDYIGQALDLRTGVPYQIEVNYDLVSATVSDNITIEIAANNGSQLTTVSFTQNIQLGSGVGIIDLTPSEDYIELYFRVYTGNPTPSAFQFNLQYFQVTTSVLDQCEYSSFSIFGAKQFQDSLGGNFGDYIADYQLQGELLTHFNTLTYPYYVNSIIPNATFNRSEGNDSIFLDEKVFDGQGNTIEEVRTQISNTSDGVYTVESGITSKSWKTGTAQIISIPSNLLLDGDNGTYEDQTPANWNITPLIYNVGTPDQIGDTISFSTISYGGQSYTSGGFNTAAPEMLKVNEPLLIARFDTNIQVIQGQEYVIESTVFAQFSSFQPDQQGNSKVFIGLEGYDLSELQSYTTFTCPTENDPNENISRGSLYTSFVAKGDTIRLVLMQLMDSDITVSTGGTWWLDETTVKGPIEHLTETKPTKIGDNCNRYNTPLRWKNGLGGWEQWNFNRYRTFNETVSNRNEIRRDVTEDWDNDFINGDTEYDTINLNVRKSLTLRSGLLTENEQIILNQIRRSIKIQIQLDGVWTTVTTKPSTFLLTDESEYMREVSFEVFLPNTLVQEQ